MVWGWEQLNFANLVNFSNFANLINIVNLECWIGSGTKFELDLFLECKLGAFKRRGGWFKEIIGRFGLGLEIIFGEFLGLVWGRQKGKWGKIKRSIKKKRKGV